MLVEIFKRLDSAHFAESYKIEVVFKDCFSYSSDLEAFLVGIVDRGVHRLVIRFGKRFERLLRVLLVKEYIKILRVECGYFNAGGFDGKVLRLDWILSFECMTKRLFLAMLSRGGNTLKHFLFRLARLLIGLVLYAAGIVLTLNAQIGYGPWEVFHVGLAKTAGISIGSAAIVTGLVIALFAVLLGEKLGLGTILNMTLIGIILDAILLMGVVPVARSFITGLIMMVAGLFVIAIASFFYIGSGFGAGPRDSLMVALTRKTHLPVGLVRGAIELVAVGAGWRLGGMVGLGTVIAALAIGFCVQLTFRLFKFDPTLVRHESLRMSWQTMLHGKSATPSP
jgi:uncharacterized protein